MSSVGVLGAGAWGTALALAALAAFEARPDSGSRPEVAEYRQLIRDLESELAAMIAAAAG